MTALQDLLAKVEVEAGWPPDIDTPYMPPFHAVWPDWRAQQAWLANQGSLDAAIALHEAVLPGWGFCVTQVGANVEGSVEAYYSDNINPARAWLIAIIRAMIAQEEGA